jgi:hypothetical protein
MASHQNDRPEHLTSWTLAAIKQRNLSIDGHCQTPECRHFVEFDIDALIAAAGPDYMVPEVIPGVACPMCGGALKFKLGAGGP